MKFNWGNRILVVILVFIGGMGYLVYQCLNTNYELVSEEYYKDELAYQKVIDASKNSESLSSKVQVGSNADALWFQLPNEMKAAPIKGSIYFYCANASANDRKFMLDVDKEARQTILKSALPLGNYTVKIQWETGGKAYYSEQNITL